MATVVLIGVGVVLVVASLLFFLRPRWLLGWLKGMAVFAVLLLGLYALTLGITLTRYDALEGMQTVARIGTVQAGPQRWRVTVETESGAPVQAMILGDQWQMDARILRLAGPLRWLGLAPGYQLERLSGRYTSLEQERNAPRSVIGLSEASWPDLWALDRTFNLPFIEGVYGNATFMPMGDGAQFDVRLSSSGLVAVPTNDQARQAVARWGQ